MKARVLVAMIGVPVLILILGYAPYWATTVLMMALCGLGAHELMHAVCKEQGKKAAHAHDRCDSGNASGICPS